MITTTKLLRPYIVTKNVLDLQVKMRKSDFK